MTTNRYQNRVRLIGSLHSFIKFIDSEEILRVGGQINASFPSTSAKHPAILPKDSPFTLFIIADAHRSTIHGGTTQLTLSAIQEVYWIISGRNPVKSYILKCVKCARFRSSELSNGPAPFSYINLLRPFLNSGIDYAGPFLVKMWKEKNARNYKAYLALFVCFSTSVIHLELVTDYTTDAFIAAYTRFTSRKGICRTLTSDCGTNFKGADTKFKRLLTTTSKESQLLASLLANNGTVW